MLLKFITIGIAIFTILSPARDKIEARVNDDILTTSELDQILEPIYRQYRQSSRGKELFLRMKKARQSAITGWIENQLILQEARNTEGFQIDQMEVEKRFDKSRRGFESREEFDRELELAGLSEEEYKKKLEDQYKVQALRYLKIGGLVNISPQDIKDYYSEHEDEYRDDEMVRVSHILLPVSGDDKKADFIREQAEEILSKLRSGADFGEVARKYSGGPRADQGGDLGYYEKGQMLPKLDEEAFSLEVGEESEVIKTELGYHIIKCTGKKEAYLKSLEELWEEIEDKLYQAEYQERYDEWIEKLKSRAYIVVE